MTVPTVTFTENAQTGNTTSLAVNMPATRPDGDLFIAICMKDDNVDWTGMPDKWHNLFTRSDPTNVRMNAWWWVGDDEPASYTLTMDSENATAVVLRVLGARLDNPLNGLVPSISTGFGTNALAPDFTVNVADMLVIRCAVVDRDGITATPDTEVTSGGAGGSSAIGWGISRLDGPAIDTAVGTAAFTNASDEWVTATFGIAEFVGFSMANLRDGKMPDQNSLVGPFEV